LKRPWPLRGNAARARASLRRLIVRVQRLILVHGGSAGVSGGSGRCNRTTATDGACALCDISWSGQEVKPQWRRLGDELGVPLEKVCRDTASRAALAVCSNYPSIVALTARTHELLLDSYALEACSGSMQSLRDELRRSARARGLGFF
jgi:hypothetical protein